MRLLLRVFFGILPVLDDVAFFKKNSLQNLTPRGFPAAEEFEVHAEMLELLLLRVPHDRPGLFIFLDRDALFVPANCLRLFRKRSNHTREGAHLSRKFIGRLVILSSCHRPIFADFVEHRSCKLRLPPHMARNATLSEAVRIALRSLQASKLRSVLTLFGIILATTTLIAVMSVIEGMNVYIADHLNQGLGAGSFVIQRMVMIGQWDPKKYLEMQRRNPQLSRAEYEFLRTHATLSREIGMEASRNATVVGNGKTMERVEMDGASPNIELIGGFEPASGHFPYEIENQRRMPVVMLGNDVKDRIFPGVQAVGKTIEMDGIRFEVVGVAKAKGSIFGNSMDNFVIVPVETYIKYYGVRQGLAYHAQAAEGRLTESEDEVRQLMRALASSPPCGDRQFWNLYRRRRGLDVETDDGRDRGRPPSPWCRFSWWSAAW